MRAFAAVLAAVAVALLLWWPRPATSAPPGTDASARAAGAAQRAEPPPARVDGAVPLPSDALRGRVVDRHGDGIPGVQVIAVPLPPAASVATATDGSGAFALRAEL